MPKSRYMYQKARIDSLLSIEGEIGFPLFVRMSQGKYLQVFKSSDVLDKERLAKYKARGLFFLFFKDDDRVSYIEALLRSTQKKKKIDQGEVQHRLLKDATIRAVEYIFEEQKLDDTSLNWLTVSTNNLTRILQHKSRDISHYLQFDADESYLTQQALLTAVFALAIAMIMDIDDVHTLQAIGIGSLLHDIGMSKLNFSPHLIERDLYDDEWKEIKKHPSEGLNIARSNKHISKDVEEIILQHHERFDGRGYPAGLKGAQISFVARVVSIADAFSSLVSPRGGRPRMKWTEAIRALDDEMGRFDPDIYAEFRSRLSHNSI
ncbi:MAG: HD domain-containing protein [Bdellovibrionales bacterium]|nr:HD domain-containing protein [Bdellovibrionales bacterium]